MDWFRQARFGMFIHWGVYSHAGGVWEGKPVTGYAEHLMRKQQLSIDAYKAELADKFNPTAFDADAWVKTAKDAGMRYLIITAKHHDGFAMYDSTVSDFNVVKATPWKQDPMAALKQACAKHGPALRLLLLARPRLDRRAGGGLGPGAQGGSAGGGLGPALRRPQGDPPGPGADREVRPGRVLVRHAREAVGRGEPARPEGGARGQADPGGQRAGGAGGPGRAAGALRRLRQHHRQAGGVPAAAAGVPRLGGHPHHQRVVRLAPARRFPQAAGALHRPAGQGGRPRRQRAAEHRPDGHRRLRPQGRRHPGGHRHLDEA